MPPSLARDLRTVPNVITISRIALLLLAAGIYFTISRGGGIVLAVVAGVTDYVDGAVARATGQVTRLGEVLDQFCDLCFESLALTVAVHAGFFPYFVLLLFLFREFWVLSIRRFMAAKRRSIPSSLIGKLKTNFVMWSLLPTFLSVAGFFPQLEPYLTYLGRTGIGLGLLFSYVSAWGYTRAFLQSYDAPEATQGAA
jgi:cardiolipin synthase (CMP-forming)